MGRDGVLLTRLLPPRLPAGCLERPELARRIAAGLSGRLVTVLGGAGYGKSTALVQGLARCPHPAVWVSCDERLGGAPALLAHLAAGIARTTPGFGTRLTFDGPPAHQVAALCNELVATVPEDLVLVIDDVHLLDPQATAALADLVRDLPPSVHLALAGRAPFAFPLGKVRASGLLAIGEADLALTDDEIASLWARVGGAGGSEATARLRERTEGWVAGVVLAAQVGEDRLGGADAGQLFDYLAEEVMGALPARTQDFLLRTGHLERFSPELAGRVTGMDAGPVCRDLVTRHLFTTRLDAEGEWYRYHHLFRDFLRHRVEAAGPAAVAAGHRRAADAWLALGEPAEAVDHLLAAGDPGAAADIAETLADDMRLGAQSQVLVRWMDALPDALLAGRPASSASGR